MKKLKIMEVWRYKKTVQKWRSCFSSCLVRASETLHITAFHDLRNIANFTSECLDSQTCVRFFLGTNCYSFADGSFNASTTLNTSRGWAHLGTTLQCTLNCVFPVSLRKNCAALPQGIHSNFNTWYWFRRPLYDLLFCLTLFLYSRYFPFIVIKLLY